MLSRLAPGLKTPLAATRRLSLKPSLSWSKFKLIEQPAGFVVGTVNDAYTPPPSNRSEGGHHWTYEKMVTMALIPLLATPFVAGVHHPVVDASFCITLLVHCHAGVKSCIIDYIPKRVYGIWHSIASKLLMLGTCVGLYGIYVFETTSNGMFDLISQLWGA